MSNDKTREAFLAALGKVSNGAYLIPGWDVHSIKAALSASEGAAPVAANPIDSLALYKELCDIVSEANAVDTVIGRPEVLMRKLVSLRDRIGRTTSDIPATTPQPAVNGAGLSDAEIDALHAQHVASGWAAGAGPREFHYIARSVLAAAAPDAQARPVAVTQEQRRAELEPSIFATFNPPCDAHTAPPAEAQADPAAAADAPAEVAPWNDATALAEMAHLQRLVPRSDVVPVRILDVMKRQMVAALKAARLAAPVEVQGGPGLSLAQEPKYTVNGSAIVNRATGAPIPADEPVFIFRARDKWAASLLGDYLSFVSHPEHVAAVEERFIQFSEWADAHPERMKEPDTALAARPAPAAEAEPVAWMHWLDGPVRVLMDKDEAEMELERLNREYPIERTQRKMRPLVYGDTRPAAPLSEDTRDAERWREAIRHIGGARDMDGIERFCIRGLLPIGEVTIYRGSVAEHFTKAIDARRAARSATPGGGKCR